MNDLPSDGQPTSAAATPGPSAQPRRRSFRRLLLWCTLLVLVLPALGALYQLLGNTLDRRRFPMPGRLVDVGALRLHLYCTGQGSPTVILEAGGRSPFATWDRVQPEVARFARVCSYDRAGLGYSDVDTAPRTASRVAEQLHTLLATAAIPGPYVLAGHSIGGFYVRVFAHRYPREVVGLVLVDSSSEDQVARLGGTAEWQADQAQDNRRRRRQATEMRLGLFRLEHALRGEPIDRDTFLWEQPEALETATQETAAFLSAGEEARAAGSLGGLPLVVLTSGTHAGSGPSVSPEEARRIWVEELQAHLARLSSRGKQVVLMDSGHGVPDERPDAVVGAIREVWTAGAQGPTAGAEASPPGAGPRTP
ncbi:MAG TPA: alpha/beta hydrolase [Polyangia bacterium]|nr:alpha/beta hydrolase [Polyangia bacterium]